MIDKNAIQFEKHWRTKIAEEVKELIDRDNSINAYGVYLFINGKAEDA